jgi:hypothetical protein
MSKKPAMPKIEYTDHIHSDKFEGKILESISDSGNIYQLTFTDGSLIKFVHESHKALSRKIVFPIGFSYENSRILAIEQDQIKTDSVLTFRTIFKLESPEPLVVVYSVDYSKKVKNMPMVMINQTCIPRNWKNISMLSF